MHWLHDLIPSDSVEGALARLSLAVSLGLLLGMIRVRGVKLGVAAVLFTSLIFGQLGLGASEEVLNFLRDFSLILFVYTTGLQVGPGFVDSLKAEGLRLNLLSAAVLLLGGLFCAGIVGLLRFTNINAAGLYSGAFTTTAGLAAGQETLRMLKAGDASAALAAVKLAGLGYAATYPFGLIGPVLSIVLLRKIFNVDVKQELAEHLQATQARRPEWTFGDIEVTNPEMVGMALRDLNYVRAHGVVFSRLLRERTQSVPRGDTQLLMGDVFRVVSNRAVVDELTELLGRKSELDLGGASAEIQRMELIATRTHVLRKSLRELNLINRLGVTIARVSRAGVDFVPNATTALHFGDTVTAIGPQAGLKSLEDELGNSTEDLNRPQVLPIFLGIILGVVAGSIPLGIPGVGGGIRIGLAGGPMIVAIILSRLGNIGSVVWYMPSSANQLFRDFGMATFLACVGMTQGDHFIQKMSSNGGLGVILWGTVVTMVPLLTVATFARLVLKMNFVTLSGWIAGAMTSAPALLFAGEMTASEAPAMTYAAVAPLAMIIPIICCEVLAGVR